MIVMLEAQKRGFDNFFFNRVHREVSTQDILVRFRRFTLLTS